MTTPAKHRTASGPLIITILVITLIVLHQDNWLWENTTLVFGIVPIGLFFHICISIAASVTWFLATRIAWPAEIIEQAKASTTVHAPRTGESK